MNGFSAGVIAHSFSPMRFNYKESHYQSDFGDTNITHETAIGSIDRKQMETLMVKWLEENEAVDVIVRGVLK